MTSGLFPGSAKKVARARSHIATIEAELAQLLSGAERGVRVVPSGNGIGFEPLIGQDAIDDIATAVGDVVHNLRAALDLMASRIVALSGGNPKSVHFPIAQTEDGLTAPKGGMMRGKNFHRASSAAQALLLTLKPHAEPHGNVMLRALHDLDVVDKHQDILRVSQLVLTPDIFIHGGRIDVIHHQEGYPEEFRQPAVRLLFAEPFVLAQREVIPMLNQMAEMVDQILDAFGALFQTGQVAPTG